MGLHKRIVTAYNHGGWYGLSDEERAYVRMMYKQGLNVQYGMVVDMKPTESAESERACNLNENMLSL